MGLLRLPSRLLPDKIAADMKMVALLRGINVGGHRRVPMAELRQVADDCFATRSQTYIQSGNLVFAAKGSPPGVEARLEAAIRNHFGFTVDVFVRTEKRWSEYVAQTAFEQAARQRPKQLHLCLCKSEVARGAVADLEARATLGERVVALTDALLIDFAGGVGASKLTPAVLDRAAGCCVTARNFITVRALAELMSATG